MRFTASIAAAILAFSATGALARPTPQIAGEGSAADSILTDTDNGVGYGTENAEDNIAKNIASITGNSATSGGTTSSGGAPPPPPPRKRQIAGEGSAADSILTDTDNGVGYGIENAEDNIAKNIASVTGNSATSGGTTSSGGAPPPPPPRKRQIAGEGSAADSILTDTDNGVGYGTENAEDNIAKNIASVTGNSATDSGTSSGGSAPPPPPPGPKARRQLDKISNGFGAIGNAAGAGTVTDPIASTGDTVDGDLTSGAANAGAEVGQTEETTLENAGSSVPKKFRRQLDKISNGFGAIGNAAGAGTVTDPIASTGDTVDGDLTSGAANAGAEVGQTEETTLENAGSSVPKFRRQLDKISNGFGAIGNAAGLGTVTGPIASTGDTVDGDLTSGAANAGAEVGQTEETTLENVGSSVPKL